MCLLGIVLRDLVVAEEVGVAQVEPGEVGVAWVSGSGRRQKSPTQQ